MLKVKRLCKCELYFQECQRSATVFCSPFINDSSATCTLKARTLKLFFKVKRENKKKEKKLFTVVKSITHCGYLAAWKHKLSHCITSHSLRRNEKILFVLLLKENRLLFEQDKEKNSRLYLARFHEHKLTRIYKYLMMNFRGKKSST